MKVLIDTSAWIALVAANDPHHDAVVSAWRMLLGAGARVVTTSDMVAETITFLRYRATHQTAVAFQSMISDAAAQGRLQVVWVEAELFAEAWKIFMKFADQALSMADCTSIALCRRERIRTALTLDKHFRLAGLETLPFPAAKSSHES